MSSRFVMTCILTLLKYSISENKTKIRPLGDMLNFAFLCFCTVSYVIVFDVTYLTLFDPRIVTKTKFFLEKEIYVAMLINSFCKFAYV